MSAALVEAVQSRFARLLHGGDIFGGRW